MSVRSGGPLQHRRTTCGNMSKRFRSLGRRLILIALVATMMSGAVFAAHATQLAAAAYPLTVKIWKRVDANGAPIYENKTYASPDDLLGFPINGGRSNWTYKTYRVVPFGWTTQAPNMGEDKISGGTPMYRDFEPISAIPDIAEGSVLYPVVTSEGGLMAMTTMLSAEGSGALNIARYMEPEEMLLDTSIKTTGGDRTIWDGSTTDPAGDIEIKREVTGYYDQEKDYYDLVANADFTYADLRVPFTVMENPLGTIKSATGVTDFSGEKPLNYSFEDLMVNLDPRAEVAAQQKDWTFTSSTFMVAAVLDENHKPLPITLEQPGHDSLVSTFSFDNSGNPSPHKFIVRTVPRNDVGNGTYTNDNGPSNNILTATGAEVAQPMTLSSGDRQNVRFTRSTAKELALNTMERLDFHGSIVGSMAFNRSQYPFPYNLFVPRNADIALTEAKNHAYVDIAPALLKFDKNSASFGDMDEQNRGYSIFALNGALDSDDFDTGTAPSIDPATPGDAFSSEYVAGSTMLTVDGISYRFEGWNTKQDGTGDFVTGETVLTFAMLSPQDDRPEDMVLYAIWNPLIDIQGAKTWEDNNDQHGKRPDSVTIHLHQDGEEVAKKAVTAADQWQWSFTGLPKYEKGVEIVYTITEDAVAEYSAAVDGYDVTNTYITPPPPPKPTDPPRPVTPTYPTLRIPLSVSKVLQGGSLRGGEFTFQLRDGQGKVIAEAANAADGTVAFPDRTFSKEVSNWMYTIRELPGTDPDIIYDPTVYTLRVTTSAVGGKLDADISIEKDGIPYAGSLTFTNIRKLPKTGDRIGQRLGMLLGASFLLAGGAWLIGRKRKERA